MSAPILRNRIVENKVDNQLDDIYMASANDGDVKKCAAMVQKKARDAFAGTKVVDERGEPKVVFHSSRAVIREFDQMFIPAGNVGFHFGSESVASSVASNRKGREPKGYYLNIAHPMEFDVDCFGESSELYCEMDVGNEILKHLKNTENLAYKNLKTYVDLIHGTNDDESDDFDPEFKYDDATYKKVLYAALESEGYDGIVYENSFEGTGADDTCWVALYPEQIKSADPITYDSKGDIVPLSKRFDMISRFVDESSASDDVVSAIGNLVDEYDKGRIRNVRGLVDGLRELWTRMPLPLPIARFMKAYELTEIPDNVDADSFGDEFVDDIRNWLENPVNEGEGDFNWSKFEDDDESGSELENIPTSLTAKDVNGMEKMFGTTRNVEDVYFIMPDGEWLDLSGIPEKVCRRYSFWGPEHPMIGLYYGGKPSTLIRDELVKLGMIRVVADSKTPLIAIGKEPNDIQYESLSEFIHDLVRMMYEGEGQFGDDPELCLEIGHGSFSKTYNVDQLKSVIPDVHKFFSGEKPRERSIVQQFHESDGTTSEISNDEQYEKLATSDNADDRKRAFGMLVAEAKKAMPDTKVSNNNGTPITVFHGTASFGFREFEGSRGFWASTNRDYAWEYVDRGGFKKPGIYNLFMNVTNPFEAGDLDKLFREDEIAFFANNMKVDCSELEEWLEQEGYDWREYAMNVWEVTTNPLFVEWLEVLGFDGMHGIESSNHLDTWCAFSPNQLKSAELITRREDGTVIPLSHRFDTGSSDINESDEDEVVVSKTDYGYEAKIGNNSVCRCDITVGYGDRIVEELSDSVGYQHGFRAIDPNVRTVYIEDIGVDKQVRECGIGTKVMNRVVSDYGTCQIVLRAFDTFGESEPERLVGFYKKFGFDPIAETDEDGVVMLRKSMPVEKPVNENTEDDIYMSAAESRDETTCSNMVANKAKVAFAGSAFLEKNGMPKKFYHGTPFNIHRFEGGLDGITWVTQDIKYADIYADPDRHPDSDNEGIVMPLYLNAKKVAYLGDINEEYSEEGVRRLAEAVGCNYEDLKSKIGKYSYGVLYEINEYVAQIAKENGFDALVATEGGKDKNGYGFPYKVETIGVLDFNCIKSADPITYYEDGSIVPLSKRFDFGTDDIRETVESVETAEVPAEAKEVELEKPCWKHPDDWKTDEFIVEFKDKLGYPDDYWPDSSYRKTADAIAREYTLEMPTDTAAEETEGDAVMLLMKSGLKEPMKVAKELGGILIGERKEGARHKNRLNAMRKAYLALGDCSARFDSKNDICESESHDTYQGMTTTKSEVRRIVAEHLKNAAEDIGIRIVDFDIHGSRGRGTARKDSDLDVVFEYDDGDGEECTTPEDYVFNRMAEFPLEIDGIKVDFNPINADDTGSLDEYMERDKAYDKEKKNLYSENFQKWFGNSVVRDKSGNPLVVYHGSDSPDITSFDNKRAQVWGVFFSDSIVVASDYSMNSDDRLYKCYLRIENPFIVDAKGSKWSNMKFDERRKVMKVAGTGYVTPLDVMDYAKKSMPDCDGVIIKNVIDTNASQKVATDYIVFSPEQIKSVDNNGEFSTETTNIFEKQL